MSEWKERPEYTPVPPAVPARGMESASADAPAAGIAAQGTADADDEDGLRMFSAPEGGHAERDEAPAAPSGAPVRAINEDDDGYDPYSDWHDQGPSAPLFERDPWE
ncbi:MAG: hypothetical protein ACOX12_03830 [Eggerthellaceae bacterium]|jgi:hypothetical protein